MIASLRDGSKGEVSSGVTSSEYEEVCHERDMFKDEVNQVKYKMEQLKADLQVKSVFPFFNLLSAITALRWLNSLKSSQTPQQLVL